jgi:hypothetical protein
LRSRVQIPAPQPTIIVQLSIGTCRFTHLPRENFA